MMKKGIDAGKRLYFIGGLALLLLYSVNCFVILPVRNMLASDIVFASNIVLINLMSLLSELLEVTAISFFYATFLLALYRCGARKGAAMLGIFAAVTAYKYAANTAVSWAYEGSIPSAWGLDIANVLFYVALEMLQLIILYALVQKMITAHTDARDVRNRAIEKAGGQAEKDRVYPFTRLYEKSNCLLRSALTCAVVTVIAKCLGSLISDIWLIALYGLPEDPSTWLLMAVNYISMAIFGFVVYFVTVAGMNALFDKTAE